MITQLSSSCTAVRSVQSQRCSYTIYRNKYSVDFYLPCFSFVTTSVLHLSKLVQIYYKQENACVVVIRPSPCGKEIFPETFIKLV